MDRRQQKRIEWLGYEFRRSEGAMEVCISAKAWAELAWELRRCHAKVAPIFAARDQVLGWLQEAGPAYLHDRQMFRRRLEKILREEGFGELRTVIDWSEIATQCENRWKRARCRASERRDRRPAKASRPDRSSVANASVVEECPFDVP